MRADSVVGRGSTFSVYLPALAERAKPAAGEAKRAPLRGDGELILVVDDEAAVLRMTTLVLESFGYRVLLDRTRRRGRCGCCSSIAARSRCCSPT